MWIRSDNHIAISENGKIAHLEAIDVYDALQNGITFCGKKYFLPQEEITVTFSVISKEAIVELYSKNSKIFLCVSVDGVKVDFIQGHMLDQIITDEWHYISNAEELNILFDGLRVVNDTPISVKTYIELLRRDYNKGNIRNNVSHEALCIQLEYQQLIGLEAELYEYQKKGYIWLDYMLKNTFGCILGDEMGLGKTLQAIALIVERKNHGEKCLVVAPVSLLDNWKNECRKFAPSLSVLLHHGVGRTGNPNVFDTHDVIVTSYGHAVRDNVLFCMRTWDLLILDEAQNIKNPESSRSKTIKNIPARQRLAVTGTPFENHVMDIWSLTDFVIPGFLGTKKAFQATVTDDTDGAKQLEPLLSSIMLRRIVKDVAQDLPEKIIISQPLSMPEDEAGTYEAYRKELADHERVNLGLLTKLRMYCTHSFLYDDNNLVDPAKKSLKYQRCCEILEEIFSRNEKAIIFTSYRKMFDIFQRDLVQKFKIAIKCIHGSIPVTERQGIVDWFNTYDGSAVLILNPKAAGTGLNITSANHVIHYNLEWNPALEDQASARAYRKGQIKTTFIYRLFYLNTVEEVINNRLERKRDMSSIAVIGRDGYTDIDMQDVIDALQMSPIKE